MPNIFHRLMHGPLCLVTNEYFSFKPFNFNKKILLQHLKDSYFGFLQRMLE